MGRSYREENESLRLRDARLARRTWLPEVAWVTWERRQAIEAARIRIWRRQRELKPLLLDEEQAELWPNGLPAHP